MIAGLLKAPSIINLVSCQIEEQLRGLNGHKVPLRANNTIQLLRHNLNFKGDCPYAQLSLSLSLRNTIGSLCATSR